MAIKGVIPKSKKEQLAAFSKLDALDPNAEAFEPGVAVADATDETDIVDQFNALLGSLRDAGIIAE